jgi:hypothetical protein
VFKEVAFPRTALFGGPRRWPDAAMLAVGSAPAGPGDLSPPRSSALLPSELGAAWRLEGTAADGKALTLETRVTSAHGGLGGTVEAVYESRFLQKMERPRLLTEVYRSGPAGIEGVATGERGEIRLEPPLPLVRLPLRPGAFETWRGRLLPPGGAPIPASAVCRIDGIDTVKTPAGTFRAYRLDMQVRISGDAAPPRSSTLFLAPGVGFVRQEIGQAPGVSILELRSHSAGTRGRGGNP